MRRVVSWLEGLKGVDDDDEWIPARYEIPLDGIFVPRDVVRRVMRAPLMPRSMAMGGAMNGGGGGRVMWYRCPGAVVRYCGETTVGPRGGVTVRLDSSMGAQVCCFCFLYEWWHGGCFFVHQLTRGVRFVNSRRGVVYCRRSQRRFNEGF